MNRSLIATGIAERFHVAILSDTTSLDVEEESHQRKIKSLGNIGHLGLVCKRVYLRVIHTPQRRRHITRIGHIHLAPEQRRQTTVAL